MAKYLILESEKYSNYFLLRESATKEMPDKFWASYGEGWMSLAGFRPLKLDVLIKSCKALDIPVNGKLTYIWEVGYIYEV